MSGAIWLAMGYTVLLCFCLFKTGSMAKAVFSAPLTEGLPIGTYNIIYADPPWRYEQRKVQGAAENQLSHHEH